MSRKILDFDFDEIDAANAWHGGQSSMLYAVASTGALSCGTVRPRVRVYGATEHDYRWRDVTDLEWKRDLVERLESEASADAENARERAETPLDDDDDPDELHEQANVLESIAAKCRAWLDANPNTTKES